MREEILLGKPIIFVHSVEQLGVRFQVRVSRYDLCETQMSFPLKKYS